MKKLSEKHGIAAAKLSKVCDKQGIPRPPQGYWTLMQMGREVTIEPLPAKTDNQSENLTFDVSQPKVRRKPPQSPSSDKEQKSSIETTEQLDDLKKLHPAVKVWVRQHRDEQAKRKLQKRNRRHSDFWTRLDDPLPNLTERDQYRLQATSTIFHALEKEGIVVTEAKIIGNFKLRIGQHVLDCTIKEKMRQGLSSVDRSWSAYPDHHQGGLHSSGFLRFSVNTYVAGSRLEWVEKPNKLIVNILPNITAGIVACGPKLDAEKIEREERERRYEEERRQRYEEQQRREIDNRRWKHFQDQAESWEATQRLATFIDAIEQRILTEPSTKVDGHSLETWLKWSKDKLAEMDPMNQSIQNIWSLPSRW
ncbi:MAG: hypothetical protein ABJL72_18070 [Roseobacter sp.]